MPRLLPLLFAAIVLSGCRHSDAPTLVSAPPPSLGSSGWTAVSDSESGVSLALPPGWRVGVARAIDAASLMGGEMNMNEAGGPAQELGAQLIQQDQAA